jgi:leucyl aminopeptidase
MNNTDLKKVWDQMDPQDVEFNFGLNIQAETDLCVVDFGSRISLLERVAKKPAAKEYLQEALKELKKPESKSDSIKSAAPQVIRVPYEGKGQLIAVILMDECSTFVLHTAIRKAFSGVLNPSEKVNLSVNLMIAGMKESLAKSILSAVASLSILVRFRPVVFGKKAKDQKRAGSLTVHIQSPVAKPEADALIEEACILAASNNQVRFLSEVPGNILEPVSYRGFAESVAKDLGVQSKFYDVKDLKKRNAGAFLAVVQADLEQGAGILHLKYAGSKKASSKKNVAIVGKGLCFDTGGYNVKTGDHMFNMHRDMTGSAVALSVFRSLVEMQVPYEVNAYLALATNLISPVAYRPNDLVIASNGLSIEVIDTDAEGRMALSDTLVLASETNPEMIIDFATLTGSVVRSLDTRRCGAYSNQKDLAKMAVKTGDQCGERVWSFPIGEDYFDALKSEVADIRQCSSSSAADHIYAATFLSEFVGKSIPWIHIDLAADTNKGGLGLVPTESTGFGVRFGVELIRNYLDT